MLAPTALVSRLQRLEASFIHIVFAFINMRLWIVVYRALLLVADMAIIYQIIDFHLVQRVGIGKPQLVGAESSIHGVAG